MRKTYLKLTSLKLKKRQQRKKADLFWSLMKFAIQKDEINI